MATLLLQAAGAYLGGFLGATGVTIGTAAGALAGYTIDQWLIGSTRTLEGPRLKTAPPFSAEDGAPVPRLYGTARMSGTLIWATRFEETRTSERQGAKGGPKVNSYHYHANAAFALCEGEIAHVRRVWADGRELDLSNITLRVYRGEADQQPDPLIEAKQGAGNAPAYRGIAYVVFERLALEDYGNRLPQLQFEVIRPVGELHRQVRAVALIPGSTEFGYAPGEVTSSEQVGTASLVNRHSLFGETDLTASIDELQAICPNLTHVALVVTWFGNDLRAGECRIRPAVTDPAIESASEPWQVAGFGPQDADVVTQDDGRSAYGGSPSDQSVLQAIAELKARGLEVTLYPFIMMDIAAGNGLPDPYGGTAQAAYPWRGRITCHPAAGQPGSADKTAAAREQAQAFAGAAQPEEFSWGGGNVVFSGDPEDWGYRRFVLHYAALAEAAGGVDAFLIGSELRGLTTIRDDNDAFPVVEMLAELAGEVRGMLGPGTKLSYGADWSEYFGYRPADGSGDVYFHLDLLWAHPAIDAVGIDNYMPLADWRDADTDGSNPDGAAGPYDAAALRAGITGGEGFDWCYPTEEDRRDRARLAITDGTHGKPWVYRYKDIQSWWANQHFDRPGGVEDPAPTAWVPQSKPIWFTELGCPACDKGPNQPNVFVDPKSSESALPHFSSGGRSDLAQHRFLRAHLDHWDEESASFEPTANPISPVYGGRMVDAERCYLWAWDTRPFPAFPLARDVWGDAGNWPLGHWLNGRLANPTVGDLVNAVLADHGLPAANVLGASGSLVGYVATEPVAPRANLDELAEIFGLSGFETADGLVFRSIGEVHGAAAEPPELVAGDTEPVRTVMREPAHELPGETLLAYRDPFRDYRPATARSARPGVASRQETLRFSGYLEEGAATALVADWHRRRWRARETIEFMLPASDRSVAPGSLIALPPPVPSGEYVVTEIDEGVIRRITARRIERRPATPELPGRADTAARLPEPTPKPLVHLLDLPTVGSVDKPHAHLRIAVWARPWRSMIVYASAEETGFEERGRLSRPAVAGELTAALAAGPLGRPDRANIVRVRLFGGELASVSQLSLLNGANVAAVRSASGVWEVLQFRDAVETSANEWALSELLRGQLGTQDATISGAPAGAPFVLLDEAVQAAGLRAHEAGLVLNWRVGPSGGALGGGQFATLTVAGGVRAALPLSPVHLRAQHLSSGDVDISWTRRGRLAADSWESAEIPLGEEAEAYVVEVRDLAGTLIRSVDVTAPRWTYTAADVASDFAELPATVDILVRQKKSPTGTAGLAAVLRTEIA
ncbi:host specificity protein [Nitratireductor mangrovi]|uniref:Host specificity protein n=1 Tax=Nitratireductor mangrovi TaxID=2599600 RepID=A0A5B8KZV9_9HYPH|nr:glycoside hydrolase TIM-barrel-like domain-containing protein [Nitratireductor mangrovi]QDZ01126.1 host specificity protein [Nitratireductor mangrovi]